MKGVKRSQKMENNRKIIQRIKRRRRRRRTFGQKYQTYHQENNTCEEDGNADDEDNNACGENYLRPVAHFTQSDSNDDEDFAYNKMSDSNEEYDDDMNNPAAWFKQQHIRRRTLTEELDPGGMVRSLSAVSLHRNSSKSSLSGMVDGVQVRPAWLRSRRKSRRRSDSDPSDDNSLYVPQFGGYSVSTVTSKTQ